MSTGAPNPRAEVARRVELVTCSGCDAAWTARNAAHCGSCHALFASVFFRDGMWRGPELSDEQRDRLRGLAS
jgi:hypothetical protein